MAIVPFNRGPRPPVDPLAGVSDAHKLMALGQLYQQGLFDPTPMNPPQRETEAPTEPGPMYKYLKDVESGMEEQQQFPDEAHERPTRPTEKISEKKNIESLPEMPGGGGGGGSGGGALRPVEGPGARGAYRGVSDRLMGFRREGLQKGYDEQAYQHEQEVYVKLKGMKGFFDGVKGLNQSHALERAYRNWPDAEFIVPIER